MGQTESVLLLLTLALKVFTLYFAVVAVFTLGKLRRFPRTVPKTRFAVIAAARNEEAVIASLVESVLRQDYPRDLVDVYVVPNNCTDHTEDAARAAGAQIIRCLGPVSGKGEALRQTFARLLPRGYDAFVVLDADNTLAPDYLARMNDAFSAGARVCKSRTRTANPHAGAVAGCYGLYNACFDLFWNRPRAVCGLSAKLIGTGFAVRREVLEEMGGWNTETIAEDAEFAAQLAGCGYQVTWVPDAVNYDEAPTDFGVSLRQRKRWCSGVMQVARRELGNLWSGPAPRPMLRWDMTMFLLTPFASAISAILLISSLLIRLCSGNVVSIPLFLGAMVLPLLGSMAGGAILSMIGGYGLKGMGRALLFFPVFTASWMPLQLCSLFHDTRSWKPIVHVGAEAVRGQTAA